MSDQRDANLARFRENVVSQKRNGQDSVSASVTTALLPRRGRGRAAIDLPQPYNAVIDEYAAALRSAPLSDQTRRTYASKVRQYLAWLADGGVAGAPLLAKGARDRAVGDYRAHLQDVLKRKPTTVNNALAAVDDFYIRRGMGPASAPRADLFRRAPRALSARAAVRYLRGVQACPSPRDRAVALIPFYAGARIAEITGLDIDDVRLATRNAILKIHTADKVREVPIHRQLRAALTDWLHERPNWPTADNPALFLNQRGTRLSVRAAHDIITTIAQTAALNDATAQVLRHTFATRLVQGGTDLVTVAGLLGHARLETTRVYARSTPQDAVKALELLDIDQ